MSELSSDLLLGLIRRMAQGKNGVHIRDLIDALEERGIAGWSPQGLRTHLESVHGITVRLQLKVDGVNSMGIHRSDVPGEGFQSTIPDRIVLGNGCAASHRVGSADVPGKGRAARSGPAVSIPSVADRSLSVQ
ncbi:hypothetical protein ACR6C2_08285 [Streptomyces sp. INA 01156]